MRQTLCEALHGCLGCVVRSVTPVNRHLVKWLVTKSYYDTYGGFVMPCLDPVLMMTDWFS